MKKMKIKKGDKVIIITGKFKNTKGEVLKVFPKDSRLLVSGVNIVTRHVKPSSKNPGGRIKSENPIEYCNVSHFDPKLNVASKIGYRFLSDGSKIRFYKKSGEIVN